MTLRVLKARLNRIAALVMPLLAAVALAQAPAAEVCTSIVQAALQAANDACSGTGRNQVCYGNVLGEAIPADGVYDLDFDAVGDVAQVSQIKALQLSPLDEAANEWGVAVMQLQANLPDTLPGQNVTFLLFGDVAIEDAVGDQVRVPASALRATNVRLRPSTNAEVLGALPRNAPVLITGKYTNSAGEVWLRVKYEEFRTRTGWAYGYLFDVRFDDLPDVSPDSLVLNPMQAFYFRTGIGRTTCAEAPTSGVVVQTPEGAGLVNFSVNGVNVTLGSTAVISSDSESLSVALLEGTGTIEVAGVSRRLVPGSESRIEQFSDSPNSEPILPSLPRPIDRKRFSIVSDVLTLAPRDVTVPEPATRDAIERANQIGSVIKLDVQVPACPPGSAPEQCACNDVDSDGTCDAVPCSSQYPTMCVPGCRDDDGDGKCDLQCFDGNHDGRCDDKETPDCSTVNSSSNCGCTDSNSNGICDADEDNATQCLLPGPVICDPGCTNVDNDDICDAYDDCIDSDGDGRCDCSYESETADECGNGSVPTPTRTPNDSPPIIFTPTPTPESGKP